MSHTELCWKVGGQQGEGIDSTGDIFAVTLHRLGYSIFSYRHFMSLIKGGHTNYKVRITTEPTGHLGDQVHMLIAFDQTTIDFNWHELAPGAIVLYDSSTFEAEAPSERDVHLCGVPMTEMAKEQGGTIMKNMVAVGAAAAMVSLSPEDFVSTIEGRFGSKGKEIVDKNMDVLLSGYRFCRENFSVSAQLPPLPKNKKPRKLLISGNDAVALGALVAGCRFLAQYPITPATDVMYTLAELFPNYGGTVVQAEDEIAAINMAIGANYGGVRAMTCTSGPGFSLMMEALGLSGMSETPVVIVDVQRAGPSTGLPTKTEQSDLNQQIYGSHGEIPRIVLAPTTIEEAFYYTIMAFNLAEQYQCPVILSTDLYMGMSHQSNEDFDPERIAVDRGLLLTAEDTAHYERGTYRRYLVTESGISPRAVPGLPNARFVGLSNEHDEVGYEIEDTDLRIQQMDKRMRKLDSLQADDWAVAYDGDENPDLLLIGQGSTKETIREALEQLQAEGIKAGHLQIRLLHPMPYEIISSYIKKSQCTLVVEQNATGQLANQIKIGTTDHDRIYNCLKYDGDPFLATEILNRCKEILSAGATR